jgi:hypothetical protein
MTRLEAAAKFLGEGYRVDEHYFRYRGGPMSDDELSMALLKKAAERGMYPELFGYDGGKVGWVIWIYPKFKAENGIEGSGPTPLDAVLAAIEQLQADAAIDSAQARGE